MEKIVKTFPLTVKPFIIRPSTAISSRRDIGRIYIRCKIGGSHNYIDSYEIPYFIENWLLLVEAQLEFNFKEFSKDYLYTYQYGIIVSNLWEYLLRRKLKDHGYNISKSEITLDVEKWLIYGDMSAQEYMKSFLWTSRNRKLPNQDLYFSIIEFDIWDIAIIEVLNRWRNKPNSSLNSTHEEVDFSKKNDFGQDWNSLANSGSDKD